MHSPVLYINQKWSVYSILCIDTVYNSKVCVHMLHRWLTHIVVHGGIVVDLITLFIQLVHVATCCNHYFV